METLKANMSLRSIGSDALDLRQLAVRQARRICPVSLLVLIVCIVLDLAVFRAMLSAQAYEFDTQWDPPIVLFDARATATRSHPRVIFTPFVVLDTQGHIKVLWELSVGEASDGNGLTNGIYCMDGDGSSWSVPVDVIADPNGAATFWPQHAVDVYGRMHIVWVGTNAQLFHSRAPSASACHAGSWETTLVPTSEQVLYGNIAVDAIGTLHLVYAARGKDIYYMRSADGESSWTQPVVISSVSSSTATSFPSLAVDPNGGIHVVWEENQLPDGVPDLGIFSAQSQDGGATWSFPLRLSPPGSGYTQPNITALNDGSVHVFWNGRAATRGRYHRWSTDGGTMWTQDQEFIPKAAGGGQTGFPRFTTDSRGRLHLVSGTDAVTYAIWNEQRWLQPTISIIPHTLEYADIAISGGNRLHVVATDFQRVWYVQGVTDAPESRSGYLPEPEMQVAKAPTTIVSTIEYPNDPELPDEAYHKESPGTSGRASPISVVLLSSGLALLLVVSVVFLSFGKRRS
ncbi:MAG: exo-alpha-sialidase [Chloroflexi bacterium]|nr:exo-alpha-sialidase [Chloroflexota bacterium]